MQDVTGQQIGNAAIWICLSDVIREEFSFEPTSVVELADALHDRLLCNCEDGAEEERFVLFAMNQPMDMANHRLIASSHLRCAYDYGQLMLSRIS